MNSLQIYRALASDGVVGPMLGGVFPLDGLPSETNKKAFVVNLDPADRPGSHWVAVYLEDDRADYFDSYGQMSPVPPQIWEFMKRNGGTYRVNTETYQGPCSTTCGQHCMFFLYHRCRGTPYRTTLRKLRPRRYEDNDKKVIKFVKIKFAHKTRSAYDAKCIRQVARTMRK